MNENNDIDKLFQEGFRTEYPYDPNLWREVSNELYSKNKSTSWFLNFNSIFLYLVLFGCAFIKSDNSKSFQIENNSLTPLLAERITPVKLSSLTQGNLTQNISEAKSISSSSKRQIKTINESKIQNAKVENHKSNQISGLTQSASLIKTEKQKKNKAFNPVFKEEDKSLLNWSINLSKMNLNGFHTSTILIEKEPLSTDKLNTLQSISKPAFYYLEIEINRSISLNKDIDSKNQEFLDYKNSSETPSYKESVGINILTDFKFLTIGIGVHYSRYYEQINYQYDNETISYESTFDTTYRVVNGNFNSNGIPVFLIEEDINETRNEVTVEEERELLVRNVFKRIQIPIILGYSRNFGRLVAGIQASFITNYINGNSGLYVNQELTGFNDLSEDSQLKDLMFSQRNQVNLGFALNEFVLVGGRFSYEYDINSFTKEYDSRFQSYNLGIWLQWRP